MISTKEVDTNPSHLLQISMLSRRSKRSNSVRKTTCVEELQRGRLHSHNSSSPRRMMAGPTKASWRVVNQIKAAPNNITINSTTIKTTSSIMATKTSSNITIKINSSISNSSTMIRTISSSSTMIRVVRAIRAVSTTMPMGNTHRTISITSSRRLIRRPRKRTSTMLTSWQAVRAKDA